MPNNILAVAYLSRLRERGLNLTPVPVKRIGAGYHETDERAISSAGGIRKKFYEGEEESALAMLPDSSAAILKKMAEMGRICLGSKKLWPLLRAALLREPAEGISRYAEIGEGIENRLRREALTSETFEEWASRCTSKRYPRSRIQRHGVHILLGLGHWANRAFQRLGPAYIRVLGADAEGKKLLRLMGKSALLPVVTRCGAARGAYAEKMMAYDLLAAELWEQLTEKGEFGKEHTRKIIIRR